MRRAVAYELMRLRTVTSTWVLTGLSLALTLVSALSLTVSPDRAEHGLGDQRAFASVITGTAQFSSLTMGLLGVLAFGHEYRYGTMRTALCVLPHRSTFAGAKVLAVAAWSAGVAGAGVALSALLAVVLGQGRFAPDVGLRADGMARIALGVVLYVTMSALVGLALAWLFRGLPTAITLLLLIPFVAEPFLRVLLATPALHPIQAVGGYLPYTAGASLYAFSTRAAPGLPDALGRILSPLAGGVTMAAFTTVLLALALLLFRQRDA